MPVSALEAIERRRTVRNYDPNYQIPKEIMDKIMNAAQLSPTACDYQGQDYIVITNKEMLDKIEKVTLEGLQKITLKNILLKEEKDMELKMLLLVMHLVLL